MPNDDESARLTLKMGRDTTVDPPRKEIGPRGTQVLPPTADAKKKAERGADGQVVVLGVAQKPKASAAPKVDVSKVDPRRAPTQLARTRRAARPVKPAAGDRQAWIATFVILVVLVLVAAVLAWVVYKQRTGGL